MPLEHERYNGSRHPMPLEHERYLCLGMDALEHERYSGLGMDALVIVLTIFSGNTNVIMV